jgi:hypothetical protein
MVYDHFGEACSGLRPNFWVTKHYCRSQLWIDIPGHFGHVTWFTKSSLEHLTYAITAIRCWGMSGNTIFPLPFWFRLGTSYRSRISDLHQEVWYNFFRPIYFQVTLLRIGKSYRIINDTIRKNAKFCIGWYDAYRKSGCLAAFMIVWI